MTSREDATPYVLGTTDAEHQRLIRQARILDKFTERLFRDARIGPGQRVLDLGSGLGDVSILAARLVGPSGTVVGIDNEAGIVAKASKRVSEGGLHNVTFLESNVASIVKFERFDAIVGRFILEYLPDPFDVVSRLCEQLRPGGVMAIQDASWGPFLALCSNLPLRSKCVQLVYETFQRSGAHMNMETVLFQAFQNAGLPAPSMRIDIPVGAEPDVRSYIYDLFCSLLPRMLQEHISSEGLGDIATLQARLEQEAAESNAFEVGQALVGAWSRKPD